MANCIFRTAIYTLTVKRIMRMIVLAVYVLIDDI